MTLFDVEPICPDCQGKGKVWDQKLGASVPCRNPIYHLSDPGRNAVQVAKTAPQTSVDAALGALPNSGSMRRRILDFIHSQGDRGATDEEIEIGLKLRHQSASARRNELAKDGWIQDSTLRRPTSSGQQATVWIVSDRAFYSDLIGEITL